MNVVELSISGPLLIEPPKFVDERGFVSETYNARALKQFIGDVTFVQDNHAFSKQGGTVRGLHFQRPPPCSGQARSGCARQYLRCCR